MSIYIFETMNAQNLKINLLAQIKGYSKYIRVNDARQLKGPCVFREVAQLGEHRMHTKAAGSSPTFLNNN